jgi:hypothetical protein
MRDWSTICKLCRKLYLKDLKNRGQIHYFARNLEHTDLCPHGPDKVDPELHGTQGPQEPYWRTITQLGGAPIHNCPYKEKTDEELLAIVLKTL